MTTYRTGNHHGVTIVREGPGPEDVMGHHSGDQLVAVVVNGDQALAERICELLNGHRAWVAWAVEDPTIVGIAATVEGAKAQAEADNEGPLTWIEKRDGRFTAGDRDYPSYQVQPFEVGA